MPADDRWVIGQRIRAARLAADLTQERLAEYVAVDRKTIHRIEAGVSDPPVSLVVRIARALDIAPADLMQ